MTKRSKSSPGSIPWAKVGATTLALAVGVVIGFLVVSRVAHPGPQVQGVSRERYAVLASTLYAEGESLSVVREYLGALGDVDHSAFLLRLADRYRQSGDRSKQHQAEELYGLGQVLQQIVGDVEVPAVVITPTPTIGQSAVLAPLQAGELPPARPAPGTVRSAQGEGVRLRKEPTTKAEALALLKEGTRVEILNVVVGQEVNRGEMRWYKVRSAQTEGYVYYSFVAPAD